MTSYDYHVQWDIHEPWPHQETNKCVVVVGRLTQVDAQCALSCTKSSCKEHHGVFLDTSLIDPATCPVIGSLVKVYGDIFHEVDRTIIKATIVKCVNTLNTTLYHKAVKLRNNYKTDTAADDAAS